MALSDDLEQYLSAQTEWVRTITDKVNELRVEMQAHYDAIVTIERNVKNLETIVRARTDHLA